MAEVTAFTAERSQAIEDNAITGASLVGDHLVLARHVGTTIDVGSVRGPQGIKGDKGDTGEVSNADLAAAVATLNATIDSAGRGIIAQTEVSADETISGNSGDGAAKDITDATLTFTPVIGRVYLFQYAAVLNGLDIASYGANCELFLQTSGGVVLASVTDAVPATAVDVVLSGQRVFVAPSGWNVSKTLKLTTHPYLTGRLLVRSSYVPTWLSVTDLGTI